MSGNKDKFKEVFENEEDIDKSLEELSKKRYITFTLTENNNMKFHFTEEGEKYLEKMKREGGFDGIE